MEISKQTIGDGIRQNVIWFDTDPNTGSGTVCRIGDGWFYFGGLTAENENPGDYLRNTSLKDNINLIYETLKQFSEDATHKNEYLYYESILKENVSEPFQKEFKVSTPVGELKAVESPDENNPGIWILTDAPGQPGALLEYCEDYGGYVISIWDCKDPHGEAALTVDLMTGAVISKRGC